VVSLCCGKDKEKGRKQHNIIQKLGSKSKEEQTTEKWRKYKQQTGNRSTGTNKKRKMKSAYVVRPKTEQQIKENLDRWVNKDRHNVVIARIQKSLYAFRTCVVNKYTSTPMDAARGVLGRELNVQVNQVLFMLKVKNKYL